MLSRRNSEAAWEAVLLVAFCTDLQAVRHAAFRRITVAVSDVNIDFFIVVLGFYQFLCKGLFGCSGVAQSRDGVRVRRAGLSGPAGHGRRARRIPGTFADKYAAGCVVAVVACVEAYALEARDVIQERERSAELGRAGNLDFVPADRDAAFGVLHIGDERRLERVAKETAAYEESAEGLGGCESVTD